MDTVGLAAFGIQAIIFSIVGGLVGRARKRGAEGFVLGLTLGPLGLTILLYTTWRDDNDQEDTE